MQGEMGDNGEFYGTIKSYNAEKGWGFIECAETHAIHGKDIFVLRSEVPPMSEPGDRVSFSVTNGRKGVCATGVTNLDKDPTQYVAAADSTDPSDPTAFQPDGTSHGAEGGGGFVGTIKSFHQQNGWGFVECEETFQIYGKDILVINNELRGYMVAPGDTISFTVKQGNKGPLATTIEVLKGGGIDCMTDAIIPAGKRGINSLDPTGGTYYGVIKTFNPAKGWGFIECPETQEIYGKDILVLKDNIAHFGGNISSTVSFCVSQGKTGPIATNVNPTMGGASRNVKQRIGPLGPGLPATVPGQPKAAAPMLDSGGRKMHSQKLEETVCGTIKSFAEEKGWGFITGTGLVECYGKDVYVSKNSLNGQPVSPGDQVLFKVQMGQKGPMAANVVVLPPSSECHGVFLPE